MELFELKAKLTNYLLKQTDGNKQEAYFILKIIEEEIYDDILSELEEEDENIEDEDVEEEPKEEEQKEEIATPMPELPKEEEKNDAKSES